MDPIIVASLITSAATLVVLAVGNRRKLASIEVKVDGHLEAMITELGALREQVTGLGGDPDDSASPTKETR